MVMPWNCPFCKRKQHLLLVPEFEVPNNKIFGKPYSEIIKEAVKLECIMCNICYKRVQSVRKKF